MAKNDLTYIKLDGLDATNVEMQSTERKIMAQIPLLKEIFIHLQGISKSYPYLDRFTIREYFIKKLGVSQHAYDWASYEAILAKADHSSR